MGPWWFQNSFRWCQASLVYNTRWSQRQITKSSSEVRLPLRTVKLLQLGNQPKPKSDEKSVKANKFNRRYKKTKRNVRVWNQHQNKTACNISVLIAKSSVSLKIYSKKKRFTACKSLKKLILKQLNFRSSFRCFRKILFLNFVLIQIF